MPPSSRLTGRFSFVSSSINCFCMPNSEHLFSAEIKPIVEIRIDKLKINKRYFFGCSLLAHLSEFLHCVIEIRVGFSSSCWRSPYGTSTVSWSGSWLGEVSWS